jgi:heme/copper-type cytochrome/quinol oxidase subunit 2
MEFETHLWQVAWQASVLIVLIFFCIVVIWIFGSVLRAVSKTRGDVGLPRNLSFGERSFLISWGLAACGGLCWIGLYNQQVWTSMNRGRLESVKVEVMGQQFAWAFRQPGPDGKFGAIDPQFQSADQPFGLSPNDSAGMDDLIQIGELTTTAGLPITFVVRSMDVLHSFYLSEFRSQVTAMPNRVAHLSVTPPAPGSYGIACNQFCGLGHYRMVARWSVVDPVRP